MLYYERDPAPGGTGALRGIYGLDGAPGDTTSLPGVAGLERRPKGSATPGLPDPGIGSGGMMFFEDGTPRPVSIRPHPASPGDPTGGVDVTLKDGSKEHWWNDQVDGFIRSRVSPFDGGAPAVPFVPPAGVSPNSVQPGASPRPTDTPQSDPRNIRVLSRIPAPGATPALPMQTPPSKRPGRPASSAASRCPTTPCRRGSSACRIDRRQAAMTTGTRDGSSRCCGNDMLLVCQNSPIGRWCVLQAPLTLPTRSPERRKPRCCPSS